MLPKERTPSTSSTRTGSFRSEKRFGKLSAAPSRTTAVRHREHPKSIPMIVAMACPLGSALGNAFAARRHRVERHVHELVCQRGDLPDLVANHVVILPPGGAHHLVEAD